MKRVHKDNILIEVSPDWLRIIQDAIFQTPDGAWHKVYYIEPLVDLGAIRLMFGPINAKWLFPDQTGGSMFSKIDYQAYGHKLTYATIYGTVEGQWNTTCDFRPMALYCEV